MVGLTLEVVLLDRLLSVFTIFNIFGLAWHISFQAARARHNRLYERLLLNKSSQR